MLTIYLKPTNYCNVGCTHCYIPAQILADKTKMTFETLEKTALFIKEMADKQNEKDIHIIWHGGEPLTISPDFYFQAGEILDRILPSHTEGIQTSLIPFNPKYYSLVKDRFESFIGTSIDFNARAIQGSPEKYQNLWLEKVNEAKSQNFACVPLITPTKKDLGKEKEQISWLFENFPVFHFERYNAFKETYPDWQNNMEYSHYMINVFDHVMDMAKSGIAPMIRQVAVPIMGVLYDLPGDRWGGSCQSQFLVVEPDGSLNNCPDKATVENNMGNIKDGFKSFQNNPLRKKWIKIQVAGHRIPDCYECENNKWCKSGCPINPQKGHNSYGIETECSGYKTYLDHIRDFLKDPENKNLCLDYAEGNLIRKDFNNPQKYLNIPN